MLLSLSIYLSLSLCISLSPHLIFALLLFTSPHTDSLRTSDQFVLTLRLGRPPLQTLMQTGEYRPLPKNCLSAPTLLRLQSPPRKRLPRLPLHRAMQNRLTPLCPRNPPRKRRRQSLPSDFKSLARWHIQSSGASHFSIGTQGYGCKQTFKFQSFLVDLPEKCIVGAKVVGACTLFKSTI